MARLIDGASSQELEYGSAVLTAAPMTIALWAKAVNVTQFFRSMALSGSVTNHYISLLMRGDLAGDPVEFHRVGGTAGQVHTSTTGYSANTWHHLCGTTSSASNGTVYLDGGSSATGTTNVGAVTGMNRTGIGAQYVSAVKYYSQAGMDVAEAAIWDVALTAAEVLSLSKGLSPLFIRPENLVSYWPLIGRTSPEIDSFAGNNLTVTGATASSHPRIYYPKKFQIFNATAAGAPAAGGEDPNWPIFTGKKFWGPRY